MHENPDDSRLEYRVVPGVALKIRESLILFETDVKHLCLHLQRLVFWKTIFVHKNSVSLFLDYDVFCRSSASSAFTLQT